MPNDSEREEIRNQVCLPMLTSAQNSDGGWGYQRGKQSATEPTAWALLALARPADLSQCAFAVERGKQWLRRTQLPNHSWPAFADLPEGCWLTALACLALHQNGEAPESVAAGATWLCNEWPAEGKLWRRMLVRFLVRRSAVRQNLALRGWSWTPGTSSWVEPTACTLILLHQLFPKEIPKDAEKRCQLAEAMLYDRMCPGGGWNSGNAAVYGVAGQPLIGPTVWAMIALQKYRDRAENQLSIKWLHSIRGEIQGPISLALAHICYQVYGYPAPPIAQLLQSAYQDNQFLGNVIAAASCALALDVPVDWLDWERQK